MFEIIKPDTKIDFVGRWRVAAVVSLSVILAGIVAIPLRGFRLGIDFAGGTEMQVRFPDAEDLGEAAVRGVVADLGIDGASVIRFGEGEVPEFLIKFPGGRVIGEDEAGPAAEATLSAGEAAVVEAEEAEEAEELAETEEALAEEIAEVGAATGEDVAEAEALALEAAAEAEGAAEELAAEAEALAAEAEALAESAVAENAALENDLIAELRSRLESELGTISVERVEFVGPKVGAELREKGLRAMGVACLVILLYIAFRFSTRFAPGAVVALIHDVLVTSCIWILLGLEFDLKVLAALLAIIGYSLNDTIIVYDRIRENLELHTRHDLLDVLNRSVNQTLSRTLLTSATTLAAVLALLLLGGSVIWPFALAMTIGVIVGTYSSVFVAAPTLLLLESRFGDSTGKAAAKRTGRDVEQGARARAEKGKSPRGKGRPKGGSKGRARA